MQTYESQQELNIILGCQFKMLFQLQVSLVTGSSYRLFSVINHEVTSSEQKFGTTDIH